MTHSHATRQVRHPDTSDLQHARDAVRRALRPTPLIQSGDIWLKLETLQPTGSFKVRGAVAALTGAGKEQVIAASAGNHALGIAWAAETLGIPATVVIAETASPAKRAYLEQRPVTLIRYGQSVVEAEAHAIGLAAQQDLRYVSPYNDPLVIAGQSTVLDEIVAEGDRSPLRVIVPLGGGGLLAGIALRAAELRAEGLDIEVIGVEAAASIAVSAAVAAGTTIEVPIGETIADGLSGNIEPGSITVEIIREHVDRLVTVPESALRQAIRTLVQEHGIVAEGAGAAAVAAAGTAPDRRTVAIVSGKNISRDLLVAILSESAQPYPKD